jgi:uncharacterized membrane protein YobD (UPF0266 family)
MTGDTPEQPGAEQQPEAPWQYKPAASSTPAAGAAPTAEAPRRSEAFDPPTAEASWTASEFIDHAKAPSWYVALGILTLLVVTALYLFTHDFISIIAVVAMAILFGVVASRKPRVLEYHLDGSGIMIGEVFHPYAEFKSFALIEDGSFGTIMFLPLKRFMPPLSVYYSAEDHDKITDVLAHYLPMEMREHDVIDRFSRRIRF